MVATASLPPVLVVDDNEDDVLLIRRQLLKAGVRNPIVTFDDPVKAAAYLKAAYAAPAARLMPCLVFTDLRMPGMDGAELVRWIRRRKPLVNLPVFMLSSSEDAKDIRRAEAAGVTRYFVKLPPADVLARLVADAMKQAAPVRRG